jgi:hypothetical protein
MADDEGAEGQHRRKCAEALGRCRISISYSCELMNAVDVTGRHERKTVLMNWSIGKSVFVRLLAREGTRSRHLRVTRSSCTRLWHVRH